MGVNGKCESNTWSSDLYAAVQERTYPNYGETFISWSWSPAIPECRLCYPLLRYHPCSEAELGPIQQCGGLGHKQSRHAHIWWHNPSGTCSVPAGTVKSGVIGKASGLPKAPCIALCTLGCLVTAQQPPRQELGRLLSTYGDLLFVQGDGNQLP